jgi:hypothetical protein
MPRFFERLAKFKCSNRKLSQRSKLILRSTAGFSAIDSVNHSRTLSACALFGGRQVRSTNLEEIRDQPA